VAFTLTLTLGTADLSRLRWAVSPAWELLASIRTLTRPAEHAIHMPWLAAHRDDPLRTRPAHAAARDLTAGPTSHLPGFLAPTPSSPLSAIDDELDEVRRTPADVVRRDLTAVFGSDLPDTLRPLRRAPRRELAAIVGHLRGYWQRTLLPIWPKIRALLEADIHHRARTLTERGPEAMFGEIHPTLGFDPATGLLTIGNRQGAASPDPNRSLDGRGLVLVPSVFAWPRVFVKTSAPWTPVIRYPVRGIGTLWEAADTASDLAPVLGATRALLLRLLETPASTQDLASRTGLAPGGVSAHLHKLTAAGLVAPHRAGRVVRYARTARGEALHR
jgi:DNA-binding transcriptional ArsR family regulator